MYKKTLLVFTALLTLPFSGATLMRLDFTGSIIGEYPHDGGSPIGQYSGQFILDSSAPDVSGSGNYEEAFAGGSIVWNGTLYAFSTSPTSVVVRNNSSTSIDFFGVAIIGSGTVETPSFFFQLVDTSATVFFDERFPVELNLTDFDPLVIDSVNSSGVFSIFAGQAYQATIDSLSYTTVPLPGAVVLFSSGLLGMAVYSRRRWCFRG